MCRGTFSFCKWWLYFDDCALHWWVQVLHFSDLKDNIYSFSSPLIAKGKKKESKMNESITNNVNHQHFQCLSNWQKQRERKPWSFQYTCLWQSHLWRPFWMPILQRKNYIWLYQILWCGKSRWNCILLLRTYHDANI